MLKLIKNTCHTIMQKYMQDIRLYLVKNCEYQYNHKKSSEKLNFTIDITDSLQHDPDHNTSNYDEQPEDIRYCFRINCKVLMNSYCSTRFNNKYGTVK